MSADGTISVNGVLAGKLKMVDFPAGTQLTALGQSYYSAPANTKTTASQASIQQGSLESSNVNEVSSAVQLVTVQRYAELMQRAFVSVSFRDESDRDTGIAENILVLFKELTLCFVPYTQPPAECQRSN